MTASRDPGGAPAEATGSTYLDYAVEFGVNSAMQVMKLSLQARLGEQTQNHPSTTGIQTC